ncbi:MAG: hypothetical protein ABFR33_05265 [Verrucomicrobiota bacterium]
MERSGADVRRVGVPSQRLSPTDTLGGRDLFEYGLEGGEAVLLRLELAPATIVDTTPVSGNMMEMVVETPGAAEAYAPMSTTNLVDGAWTNVPHSNTNNAGTMAITNLGYSIPDASGTNEVIYVLADKTNEFFKIIAE